MNTAQTGVYTVEFYVNVQVGDDSAYINIATDGATNTVQLKVNGTDLQSYDGGWVGITTGDDVSADTWYKIEIEIDHAANTFDAWLDGVSKGTFNFDTARATSNSFELTQRASTDGYDTWVDDICIYSGARQ